ncbi:hypothetical protein KKH63_02290, partial [Patescibacteria group bacterium]|nr:hypothetical protein [Patescibacteria group bacterium]
IKALKSLLGVTEFNSEGGLGPETPTPWLEAKIKQVLAQLGLILENGIARLQEIITGKITTQELCVDDVCVTKDQFKAMLQQNGQAAPTPTPDVGVPDLTSGVNAPPAPAPAVLPPPPAPAEPSTTPDVREPDLTSGVNAPAEPAPVVESAPLAPAENAPAPVVESAPAAPVVETPTE